MHANKILRLLLAILLLISGALSSFLLPSVQAETSGSVTLSPAIVAKLDAFIVKVQALRSRYPADMDWNTFLDTLNSKVGALKPQYAGNALILTVLDRLSVGVSGLKVQRSANISSVSSITTGSVGPYNCYGLGGLKEQYNTLDEIKQDATRLNFTHAINVDGTQIYPGFGPAVGCTGAGNNTSTIANTCSSPKILQNGICVTPASSAVSNSNSNPSSPPTGTGAFSITGGPLAGHYSSVLQFCNSDAVKALPGKVYSDGSVGQYPSVSINGRTVCYAGSFPVYQATSPDFIPTPPPTNLPANCTIKDIDFGPGLSLLAGGSPTQTTNRGQMTAFRMVMPSRAGSRSGVYYGTVPTQLSISTNPCEWTDEDIKTGCASVGMDPQIWNNSIGDPSMCMLTPGVTYYFNVRNANTWNGPDTCREGQACIYKFSW
ncbi:MAG: hypothetical protein PHH16_03655 [Candidatus Gracilibacteria bacterium]|nr:hypothetical protein [Candidatus Gracilibacteria bacterium]